MPPTLTPTELVSSLYRSFCAGAIESVMESLAPDVRWRTPATLPWSDGTYHGRSDVGRYFQSFGEALDAADFRIERMMADGDDVVVLGHECATVRRTGQRFEARFAHIFHIRDGRVAAMEGIVDTATIGSAFELFAVPPEPSSKGSWPME